MTFRSPSEVNPLWEEESVKHQSTPFRPNATKAKPDNPLPIITAANLAGLPRPEREFLDEQRILPMRNTIMLSGDGGVGKSWIAMQLAVAIVAGTPWLDIAVRQGGTLYVSAEDDFQETHARLFDICEAEGIDLASLTELKLSLLAGRDAVLAVEDAKAGRMQATKLYQALVQQLEHELPTLLILDNLADIFSGNENSRPLAKQFIGMLRHLAIEFNCVVLILGHPSLSGLASGSGTSGSTAWNNSVRARLYLHTVKDGNGVEVDETVRLLEVMKSNYSAKGLPIGLQWKDGRFVRKDPPKPFDAIKLEHLEMVRTAFRETSYRTSDQSEDWGGYVVANIAELDVGRGLAVSERTSEQNRARSNVRIVLNRWVENKQLCIVERLDAKSRPRKFFGVVDDAE
ncbi:AAA family ATPase [Phyllobacterium sp. SYP-B3895]|uniref:AAA family ATPase n=1 Tax=Phyllobacterium sp. SYP-B3895 TaxID=2663240 RepID=UPI00129A0249|nr:AAA family ATPase [Phyllobacterium sp. SYP-B3895]MRG55698.1 AAA family ATPase [Phyllobacterium sp. SYP-B3895]